MLTRGLDAFRFLFKQCMWCVVCCLKKNVIPFILDVRLVDVYQPGLHMEEGHTGLFLHLPSAVLALIFIARRIQPPPFLIDRDVEYCVPTK